MARKSKYQIKKLSINIHKLRPYLISSIVIVVMIISVILIVGIVNKVTELTKEAQYQDYIARAENSISSKDYQEAFTLLQQALSVKPNDKDALIRQADVAFLSSDYETATTLYKRASVEQNAELLFYSALKNIGLLNLAEAEANLTSAKKLLTEDRTVLSRKTIENLQLSLQNIKQIKNEPLQKATAAKVLIENNALKEASELLTNLLIEEPKYRDAHYLLAVTYARQGREDLAIDQLNETLKLDPNYEPALRLQRDIGR